MEQTQTGDEREKSPDRIVEICCLGSEDQRGGEGEAQPKGLSADAGERTFAIWEEGRIVWEWFAGEWTLDICVVVLDFVRRLISILFARVLRRAADGVAVRRRGEMAVRLLT